MKYTYAVFIAGIVFARAAEAQVETNQPLVCEVIKPDVIEIENKMQAAADVMSTALSNRREAACILSNTAVLFREIGGKDLSPEGKLANEITAYVNDWPLPQLPNVVTIDFSDLPPKKQFLIMQNYEARQISSRFLQYYFQERKLADRLEACASSLTKGTNTLNLDDMVASLKEDARCIKAGIADILTDHELIYALGP